ncbi:hypothetical protein C9374_006043 [Naegleria lovaniensis]|uniref:Uncharacterized protein n=1 Tax=Naegleria lovaniensis TaxID=51637 RepID=A0AA88GIL7_NAELO|nr:uncharacterized protein C9374_006043 [Naegleria lovaniensis]KAG2381659.1 hypothetical protein C9374_006043 [Naegleria lovaniensis]
MEPSSPQGTTTLDNAPESNNTLVICDQNHVQDNMTEEIPKLNTILNSNLSVHDSIDPPPHTQQDSSALGVNNNPSNPLFNDDQLSRFSKLKQVYTSSRSLWLIHSISLFYVLYSCMTVYLSLNQIYNVSANYQHEWVKTNDFPSKIVGEGIYTSVKNFNQPKLEISEP